MRICAILLLMAIFIACTVPPKSQVTTPSSPVSSQVKDSLIIGLADASPCAKVVWKNRGVAPVGFIEGLAVGYARAVCEGRKAPVLGSPVKDALALYGEPASLRATWTLLFGLGMRESSGKYCVGRDVSAKNTESDTAEAGLFQASWNSHSSNTELEKLFARYRGSDSPSCLLDVFKKGVPPIDSHGGCVSGDGGLKSFGGGPGFDFQELEKKCPAFAADYASIAIRDVRRQWGPLNRKEAEFRSECSALLVDIETLLRGNPTACGQVK